MWEIIFAEPNFYNHLLQSGVPEDYIIRFAFDSVDDLHLIGESLIDLQEGNNKINPEKFMNYIRSWITNAGIYYLLLDEVQLLGSFEDVLNAYLRTKNLDVFVTGSKAKFISSDIVT